MFFTIKQKIAYSLIFGFIFVNSVCLSGTCNTMKTPISIAVEKRQKNLISFGWAPIPSLFPTNYYTDRIPSQVCPSSYKYPKTVEIQTGALLGYSLMATACSMGFEFRENRKEMMKRGEFWTKSSLKAACKSSFGRRITTMLFAVPLYTFCCSHSSELAKNIQQRIKNRNQDNIEI